MANRAPSGFNETWRLRAIMLPEVLVRVLLDWARPDTTADRLGTIGMREPVSLSMIDAAVSDLTEMNEQVDSGELDVLISELQELRQNWPEYKVAAMGYDEGDYDLNDMEIET
jgi:hypothetical protein